MQPSRQARAGAGAGNVKGRFGNPRQMQARAIRPQGWVVQLEGRRACQPAESTRMTLDMPDWRLSKTGVSGLRQRKIEGCSFPLFAVSPDSATMLGYDLLNDSKSYSGPLEILGVM